MQAARLKTDQSLPQFIARKISYFSASQIICGKHKHRSDGNLLLLLQKEEDCCNRATD